MEVLPVAIWSTPLEDRSVESVKGYGSDMDGGSSQLGPAVEELEGDSAWEDCALLLFFLGVRAILSSP